MENNAFNDDVSRDDADFYPKLRSVAGNDSVFLEDLSPSIQGQSASYSLETRRLERFAIFAGLKEVSKLIVGENGAHLWQLFCTVLTAGFHAFLGIALSHNFRQALGLLVLTVLVWSGVLYYKILKPLLGDFVKQNVILPAEKFGQWLWTIKLVRWAVCVVLLVALVVFLIFETADNRWRLVSFAGLVVFLLLLWLFSTHPTRVKWRPVVGGMLLQFLMSLLVLRWPVGNAAFDWLSGQFATFLAYTQNGTSFVYGFLVFPPNICGMNPVFAFTALQTILYVASVISILYNLGVMQFTVSKMAWLMEMTLGTTGPESLTAAASIFVGNVEAPLAVKPYMLKLTESEWFAIMTAGLSTISGSVFAIYISFGACPVHLLAASVMSAPAALAVSKLFYPETEESQLKKVEDLQLAQSEERNVIEAAVNGASAGMEIVMNVIGSLVVFLALLAFMNSALSWLGAMVGVADLTLEVSFT